MTEIKELMAAKQSDITTNNLTYLTPTKNFSQFYADELMWVLECDLKTFTVFRTMDGKNYTFKSDQLKKFKRTGRR